MDAQYPFASREDIWRVFEEVKDLYATQIEHGERLARLERRKDDDARLKSVWGPLSPFPSSVSGVIPPVETPFNPAAEAFRGFDQGHQQGLVSAMALDGEDEPRRGASRANSVRFDESAIHGYYGQVNRSSSELPLRTGSGMSGHPLTERSLSHRSDGRQSSSGQSHHSARTNSLGLDTSRLMGSTGGSPMTAMTPPPGLFILGPVPCIIRCWLTTNFSNDSLLYAAVCSGSYTSFLCHPMIERLGLEDLVVQDGDLRSIKLPVYLPEASVHQTSSRAGSPTPQLPSLTIRFLIREVDHSDKGIQIFLGSDILRSHNADILFSQDKILMVDDERNKISIPLVRPENDSVFKNLTTVTDRSWNEGAGRRDTNGSYHANGSEVGVIGRPTSVTPQDNSSAAAAAPVSKETYEDAPKPSSSHSHESPEDNHLQQTRPKSSAGNDSSLDAHSRPENTSVWSSWRRDSKADANAIGMSKSTRGRAMKVLRPSKSSSSNRAVSTPTAGSSSENTNPNPPENRRPSQPVSAGSPEIFHPTPSRSASTKSGDGPWSTKPRTANPVGGASAFGWLNSQQPK
ncbi:hypothetical protein ANI_1_584104 [Paecilomyces variotii No. 5]|uniref:Ubiquitin carboxyl-terminal hydrolase 19 n=1 Tax=Byssochlamys spectabilis (strain No. 5 / NBRC 109023) TaxID=1356009 RepID=V5F9X9_BYSSN|nr:hypothetical protein ANI_1_584104 [Paecilomyces variotii No. 5]